MNDAWQHFFRICVMHFRVAPADFWQLTIPELEALLIGCIPGTGIDQADRNRLNALMERYPDRSAVGNSQTQESNS